MTETHDFVTDLAWSKSQSDQPWWEAVYRQAFANFATMTYVNGDGWAQRGGIDRVITLTSGKTLYVDEKVRRKHYDDIFLEYWSDHEGRRPGWVEKDLACDYIAYAFAETQTCYLLPFLQLRRAWRLNRNEWFELYGNRPVPNNGYTTIGIPVPVAEVLGAITDALIVHWSKAAA